MYDVNEDNNRCTISRRKVVESIALGVAVGALVKFIIDTLGFKKTVLICVLIYLYVKYWK